MSARASMSVSPIACSGAMYDGVPTAMPTVVSLSPPAAETALATPKSVTTAWRPDSSTLPGLMSRCTTPRECE